MFLDNFWMVLTILTLAIYGFVLVKFVWSFKKKEASANQLISSLSVVVPIKNEVDSLERFFSNIMACQLGGIEIEIILVNDHSTDDSLKRIKPFESLHNIRVISAPEAVYGKKLCAKLGVEVAQYPWILTLDIDAKLPISFFNNIARAIPTNVQYALVPLKPNSHKSLARYFFDLEFISLHFVGMASAKMGKPLLSNAACSVFRKEAFIQTIKDRNDWDLPSGDDVFAMFAIAEKYGDKSIGVSDIGQEKVEVDFPNGLSDLLRQRLRWVGKSGHIKNAWFVFVSGLVVAFNMVLGYTLWQTIFHGFSTFDFVFLIVAVVLQYWFLMYVCNAVERRDLMKWIVPLTMVYPFYLIALVIAQFFWKPKWK